MGLGWSRCKPVGWFILPNRTEAFRLNSNKLKAIPWKFRLKAEWSWAHSFSQPFIHFIQCLQRSATLLNARSLSVNRLSNKSLLLHNFIQPKYQQSNHHPEQKQNNKTGDVWTDDNSQSYPLFRTIFFSISYKCMYV